jgi:hypothetical protein
MATLSAVRPEARLERTPAVGAGALGWAFSAAVMIAALLWPAIANRFPIVFYDTGGYLVAAIEGRPVHGRAASYGAFLWLGIPTAFWLNIIAQAALTVWLVVLTLRAHGLGGRPALALAVVAALAVLTGLPWYAAQLLPDIWLPDAVLALYLLAFRRRAIRRWEYAALIAVIAFAMASHLGTLGVIVGLVAVLPAMALFAGRLALPRPKLSGPAIAAAAGLLFALTSNLVLNGEFAFTRGGTNFLFGRLIQTGIAAQYLEDNCPDPRVGLCRYRRELPPDGDNWLWDAEGSPFYKLGGWDAFEPEARRIAVDSLRRYPLRHIGAFVQGTLEQFVMVQTGDGITPWTWNVHGAIEDYASVAYKRFVAARQQQELFDFTWINWVHVPIALVSIALLPLIVLLARRGRVSRRSAAFAAIVLLSLAGNAVICGALSNPHHRYQSRLVPLATLVIAIAALGRRAPPRRVDAAHAAALPAAGKPRG